MQQPPSMMTSQNGIISALLTMRGNHRWPVNSPHKGQWRGALMFSFDLLLNKRLIKQSWGWWFETPSRPLWRHCNGLIRRGTQYPRPQFNIKMPHYQYRKSHRGDQMILRPSFLHNGISYTDKTSLYWISLQIVTLPTLRHINFSVRSTPGTLWHAYQHPVLVKSFH